MTVNSPKPRLKVQMASPRGFCAGVERAIRTVEETLNEYGAPVYVRHEIVHNRHVVERLAAMGAVFIEDVADAPDDRPLIISAHGAPAQVTSNAHSRGIALIDATCPLVHKVHAQTRRHAAKQTHVYLVGHKGHPEVIGTMGQVSAGSVTLVETVEDVWALPDRSGPKAYATQTTLSVDDANVVLDALRARFPDIAAPAKQDICYATTNRQEAVKASAKGTDLYLVFGSPESSNSVRLVETAKRAGTRNAQLLEKSAAFDLDQLNDVKTIGISAGASAPESLIEEFLKSLAQSYTLMIETIETTVEDVVFNTPTRLAS